MSCDGVTQKVVCSFLAVRARAPPETRRVAARRGRAGGPTSASHALQDRRSGALARSGFRRVPSRAPPVPRSLPALRQVRKRVELAARLRCAFARPRARGAVYTPASGWGRAKRPWAPPRAAACACALSAARRALLTPRPAPAVCRAPATCRAWVKTWSCPCRMASPPPTARRCLGRREPLSWRRLFPRSSLRTASLRALRASARPVSAARRDRERRFRALRSCRGRGRCLWNRSLRGACAQLTGGCIFGRRTSP